MILVLLRVLIAFVAFTVPQAYAATVLSHPSQRDTLINRTDCAGSGDLFQVYNNVGELCFANEGVQSVYIGQIYEVCFGNNRGYWLDSSLTLPCGTPIGFILNLNDLHDCFVL